MKALVIIALLLVSSQSPASSSWEVNSRNPLEIQAIVNTLLRHVLPDSREAEITLNQRLTISNRTNFLVVVRKITRGFNSEGYYEQLHQYICNRLQLVSVNRSFRQSVCSEARYQMQFRKNTKKALR